MLERLLKRTLFESEGQDEVRAFTSKCGHEGTRGRELSTKTPSTLLSRVKFTAHSPTLPYLAHLLALAQSKVREPAKSSGRSSISSEYGLPQVCRGFHSQGASIWLLFWGAGGHRPVHLDAAQRHKAGMNMQHVAPDAYHY